jgi:hypothetical protein
VPGATHYTLAVDPMLVAMVERFLAGVAKARG